MSRRNFFKLTSSLLNVKKGILKMINQTQIFNCGRKRPRHPAKKQHYILKISKHSWFTLVMNMLDCFNEEWFSSHHF